MASTEEEVGGGKEGAEECTEEEEVVAGEGGHRGVRGRAQQLSLRGDRRFLTWVLLGSHPPWGLAGSRNGPSGASRDSN